MIPSTPAGSAEPVICSFSTARLPSIIRPMNTTTKNAPTPNPVLNLRRACPELAEGIGFVFPYFQKNGWFLALEFDITFETNTLPQPHHDSTSELSMTRGEPSPAPCSMRHLFSHISRKLVGILALQFDITFETNTLPQPHHNSTSELSMTRGAPSHPPCSMRHLFSHISRKLVGILALQFDITFETNTLPQPHHNSTSELSMTRGTPSPAPCSMRQWMFHHA